MSEGNERVKLTITINKDVLSEAKKIAGRKNIPISRLVDNFLAFLARPYVYCFKCGEKFDSSASELCLKCSWMICPKCKACGCHLSDETKAAIFHMRQIYEDLLAGRVKQS
jgi:hypothetical protein